MVVPLPHTIHSLSKDKMQLKHQYPQTWERIRDKPTYWTLNNEQRNFVVSFRVRKYHIQRFIDFVTFPQQSFYFHRMWSKSHYLRRIYISVFLPRFANIFVQAGPKICQRLVISWKTTNSIGRQVFENLLSQRIAHPKLTKLSSGFVNHHWFKWYEWWTRTCVGASISW